MPKKAPGKSYREGLSLTKLFKMFPDAKPPNDGSLKPVGRMASPALTAGQRTLRTAASLSHTAAVIAGSPSRLRLEL